MSALMPGDGPASPAWEHALRAEANSKAHDVRAFSAEHFASLAEALHVPDSEGLDRRLVAYVGAVDRDLAHSWQWDEFRALLWAACAWWRITDIHVTREDWVAFIRFAGIDRRHGEFVDADRRSFRHAWAAHEYRAHREKHAVASPLLKADYDQGRREPFKTQIQDALVALLRSLAEGGDGTEFWDPRSNTLVPAGRTEAEREETKPASARVADEAPVATPAVRAFYERVRRLEAQFLPKLLREAEQIAAEADMPGPRSWREYGRRLSLLSNIREVLQRLTLAVFDAPLIDLMPLVSPIDGEGHATRSHAKLAKRLTDRYVRPWATLSAVQLSNAVTLAIQIRREWQQLTGQAPPTDVPLLLDELRLAWAGAGAQLDEIDRVVGFQGHDRLSERTIPDLRAVLAQIAASEP